MAADDVALAWIRMHDDQILERVVAGDVVALGELDLSDEELGMVRRIAEEGVTPEVQTFETSAFYEAFAYGYGKLSEGVLTEVTKTIESDETTGFLFRSGPVGGAPVRHCSYDIRHCTSDVQSCF